MGVLMLFVGGFVLDVRGADDCGRCGDAFSWFESAVNGVGVWPRVGGAVAGCTSAIVYIVCTSCWAGYVSHCFHACTHLLGMGYGVRLGCWGMAWAWGHAGAT